MSDPVQDQTVLAVSGDVTYQPLADGRTVVLSLSDGQLYTCNETSRAFLAALDGRASFGDVLDRLCEQFDVPRDRLRTDLLELIEYLEREKLLVRSDV